MLKFLISTLILVGFSISWASADWRAGVLIPADGRPNIYQDLEPDFLYKQNQGKLHAQRYPVTVTGMLPPYEPIRRLLEEDSRNPLRKWIQGIMKGVSGYKSFRDVFVDLGLHDYPAVNERGVYAAPRPDLISEDDLMGFGLIERNGALGFTFSCAACHTSNLFGKTVLGMTNRFPKANEFFLSAQKVMPLLEPNLFKAYSKATKAETALLIEAKERIKSVSLKKPIALGLDTSLAQVSLSLNRRGLDSYASYSPHYSRNPRIDGFLDHSPADSKPAVWWNVKYKNRWLADGSVLSGNPIFTNIIWNEIGRGADLRELEEWLAQNPQVIEELTTAVFSSEAPRITDFFSEDQLKLENAKAGEIVFNNACAKCHGHYDKGWNQPAALVLPISEQLKTVQVRYKEKTPVMNVGTDPYRYQGMKSLEQLNNLAISKKNNIVIQAQEGYVPPPLVGIWARWPYFHNNSAPSLCAVLTPAAKRPQVYYSGDALDKERDFDFECNGYPVGDKTPKAWKTDEHRFDTRKPGMGNMGHDENILVKNGQEILSAQDKKNLIIFLQTL